LEVQSAAQFAFEFAECDVRLGNHRIQTMLFEFVLTEDPGEEAAAVFVAIDVDDECAC
jgi:hypothetical protein